MEYEDEMHYYIIKSDLKTEEGYSADQEVYVDFLVRTLCGHISLEIYVLTMYALCPYNVRTMSAKHLPRETCIFVRCFADIVRTLCGHISPGFSALKSFSKSTGLERITLQVRRTCKEGPSE